MRSSNIKKNSERFCLYAFEDTGFVQMEPYTLHPVERVPIMGYSPFITGTKNEMSRLLKRIEKRPYLIEKYIKR